MCDEEEQSYNNTHLAYTVLLTALFVPHRNDMVAGM